MRFWYQRFSILAWVLFPLSLLYCCVIKFRHFLYKKNFFKTTVFPVPVIVVGNISVGGTGKTPLVIAIAECLKKLGYHPGLVSRGYTGKSKIWPLYVGWDADPKIVGDEALLLVRKTRLPMVVGPDRVAAVRFLLQEAGCNVVISDDGLQHLAMGRACEVAVVDAERGFGNGWCLPAGPLREPITRLKTVNYVVVNTSSWQGSGTFERMQTKIQNCVQMQLMLETLSPVSSDMRKLLAPPARVHAVAGIGNPERFFVQLEKLGFKIMRHAFPDHYFYSESDFHFNDDLPIIMTEKDAVKCFGLNLKNAWCLPVKAVLSDDFFTTLRVYCNTPKNTNVE